MVQSHETLTASDWDSTETKTIDVVFDTSQTVHLLRQINELDVEVTVEFELTDSKDTDFSQTETGTFSDGTTSKSVGSGAVASDYLTEPWEKIRYSVTPAAQPSSGTFSLREMTR